MRLALVVLVGTLLAGAGWKWYDTPSAAEVHDDLPVYPGARLFRRTDEELHYRLPRPATLAAVHGFYARRLDGWKEATECPEMGFQRERTLMLVGTDTFDRRHLKILIKPGAAGECDTWSWFIYS